MMQLLDGQAHANRLRPRHPLEKLAFAGGLLALSLVLPLAGSLAILLAVSLATVVGARIRWGLYLRALSVPGAFIALGSLSLLFSVATGPHGWQLGLAGIPLASAVQVLARALAAAACLCFLGLTTPAMDWAPVLRQARVPAVMVDLLLIIYRCIFLLGERLTAMHTAQEARLGYASLRNTWRSSGLLGATLLVLALKRARGWERGLAARGFDAALPTPWLGAPPSGVVLAGIVLVWLLVTALGLALPRGAHG